MLPEIYSKTCSSWQREPRFSNFIVGGIIFHNISWTLIDSVVLHHRYSTMAAFCERAYALASDRYLDNYIIRHIYMERRMERKAHRHNGAISGTCSSKKLFRARRSDGLRVSELSKLVKGLLRSILRIVTGREARSRSLINILILTRNLITRIGTHLPVRFS